MSRYDTRCFLLEHALSGSGMRVFHKGYTLHISSCKVTKKFAHIFYFPVNIP